MKILKEKKEKSIIAILVIVIIILIIVVSTLLLIRRFKVNTNNDMEKEEFVQVLDDGIKLNTSDRFKETKVFDDLEIHISELKYKDNVTTLKGIVSNNTTEVKGNYSIDIHILDKQGNALTVVGGYIGEIAPTQRININYYATADYANAYDFYITKHENEN